MQKFPMTLCVGFACALYFLVPAQAAQYALDPMVPGVKYCPAPGADNSEFLHSYWAVDAQTGQMSKVTASDHPSTPAGYATNQQEEEILFVAPSINVENRYVPYPGAPAQEPPRQTNQVYASAPAPVMQGQPTGRQMVNSGRPDEQEGEIVLYVAPPGQGTPAYIVPNENALASSAAPSPAPRQVAAQRRAPEQRPQPQVQRQQPRPERVSQTAASSTPKSTMVARAPEGKSTQAALKKKAADKRVSNTRSTNEKQPWWRHIWRN